jgi:hypothetical protein
VDRAHLPQPAYRWLASASASIPDTDVKELGHGMRLRGPHARPPRDPDVRLALDGADAPGDRHGRRARVRPAVTPAAPLAATPVQRIDFSDDEIPGDLIHPDEPPPISVATRSAQSSLIELRRHFEPELIKTLEDL